MKAITFTLPYPPSVNRYWRHVVMGRAARVILSADGRRYKDSCRKVIREQLETYGVPKMGGPLYSISEKVAIVLDLFPPNRRVCDVDNYCKASLDALTAANVWEDDSQVDFLQIRRREVVKGGRLIVKLFGTDGLSRRALSLDDCPF